jgi:hypothetical protein
MRLRFLSVSLSALLAGGCAEAGTPYVSLQEAARIGVATSRITVACGNAEEMAAFAPPSRRHQAAEESIAISGVRKLAAVYAHDQTHIYQGESVGGVVNDSLSLLKGCGLPSARRALLRAIRQRHS